MRGIDQLRIRAEALRWAADQTWNALSDSTAAAFLHGIADATYAALKIVTPDYPDAEEEPPEPPADAEAPEEAEAAEANADGAEHTHVNDLVVDEIAPLPTPPPPRRFSRWTDEQVDDLRKAVRTMPKAEAVRLIAERYDFTTQRVYDKLKDLGIRGGSKPRLVPLPNPAERQLAEDAAAAQVADADIGTIRHWLAVHGGMTVPDHLTAELVAAQANERRRELGLTPFRLIRNPIGATSPAELTRMHRAGEAKA